MLASFAQELLVPENTKKLQDWIFAGGLMIIDDQNDKGWSPKSEVACKLLHCPIELLPDGYRYEYLKEASKCNNYETADILIGDHPMTQGIAALFPLTGFWDDERPLPGEEGVNDPWPNDDAIDGRTVPSVWTILAASPATMAEMAAKAMKCGADYGILHVSPAMMEAEYGDGKIVVSLPDDDGIFFSTATERPADPILLAAFKNKIAYIKSWKK